MNNVLELKGNRFIQASKNLNGGGGTAMQGNITVTSDHLNRLQEKILKIKEFWEIEEKPFKGVLISVYYNKIVAKSNRIAELFKEKNSKT